MSTSEIDQSAIEMLAICRFAGVQARLFDALLRQFGSTQSILEAHSEELMAVPGMSAATANELSSIGNNLEEATTYYRFLLEREIRVIGRFDPQYHRLLLELNDPPPLLYVRGKVPGQQLPSVAIVGDTEATNEGIELTIKLARHFSAKRVQVVSSLRRGIDTSAHLGVKASEGGSIAVLDSGFDHIFPEENVALAIDIVQEGSVITDLSPDTEYADENISRSNRLIAGMVQAVVVTELYQDVSSTMDLLSFCSEIGKLLFFVIDPAHGVLAGEKSMKQAVSYGAIPMVGLDKFDDIVNSLV